MAKQVGTIGGRGVAFGEFLSYLMQEHGIDSAQLALTSGVKHSRLRNFLDGYITSDPSINALNGISEALGVDIGDFVQALTELPRTNAAVAAVQQYLSTHVLPEPQMDRLNQAIGPLEALVTSVFVVSTETQYRELALKYNMISA